MTTATRDDVLALVRSSPVLVGAHDKTGWLGIFGPDHVVEDPVGGRPVRSSEPGALATFWDAFIAPNDIEFEVYRDWVDGLDVVRDVTVVSTLPTGVTVRTPAHLIYQTAVIDGALKVRRMAAHWEALPVYRQLMVPTLAHVRAALGQNAHMLRTLGVGGTLGFVGAVRSTGGAGKRVVLDALEARGITQVSKIIASGDTVTASCTVDHAPAAVIARLARGTRAVLDLTVYTDLA